MKYVLTVTLTFILLVFPITTVTASQFSDVPVTHPMSESITYLAERGYVSGYEDGTFKPDRTVTRAEILKFALQAREIEVTSEGENTFTDVPVDAWYYPYVLTASRSGIVSGYEDGTFQPERTVTRAEGLKIILKTMNVRLPDAYTSDLKDVTQDAWYAPYVQYVLDYHLFTMEGQEFKPDNGLKRQDVAGLMYHFIKANEINARQSVPFMPWFVVAVLYLLMCVLAVFLQLPKNWKDSLYVVLGGFAVWYFILRLFKWKVNIKEELPADRIVAHRKTFAYFKKPRRIEKIILVWIDKNMKPLIATWSVLLMWCIIVFVISTQVATFSYGKPYHELAETYVYDTNR